MLHIRNFYLIIFSAFGLLLALPSKAQENIGISDIKFIDFIRATAKVTALAKTGSSKEVVKFFALGSNDSGEVVMNTIAVGFGHGADFKPESGSAVIGHVHTSKMSALPEEDDFKAVLTHKIPNFVISSDGEKIWELAIISGIKKYRSILHTSIGDWEIYMPSPQ